MMIVGSSKLMIHLENAIIKGDTEKFLFLDIGWMPVFTRMSGVSRHMES